MHMHWILRPPKAPLVIFWLTFCTIKNELISIFFVQRIRRKFDVGNFECFYRSGKCHHILWNAELQTPDSSKFDLANCFKKRGWLREETVKTWIWQATSQELFKVLLEMDMLSISVFATDHSLTESILCLDRQRPATRPLSGLIGIIGHPPHYCITSRMR